MFVLLLFFGLVIFGYNYITDSSRVKEMAQTYLSRLIGGRVVVHSATLSIFEGLRLEGVKVYADDGDHLDSLLFSAQSFILKYDPAKIITGQLEATQIIAQKPHVHLTQDLDTHQWNFLRLAKSREQHVQPQVTQPGRPPPLPEVLLRNARVEIAEVRDGRLREVGYEGMDGQLSPSIEPGSFNFEIQTHGVSGVGPWATGTVSLGSGRVDAQLHDFDYTRDVESMMPQNAREFAERHAMAERIVQLSVHYDPGVAGSKPHFLAETTLANVSFSAQQEDYLGTEEVNRRHHLRDGVAMMQRFYRSGGFIPHGDDQRQRPGKFQENGQSAQRELMEPEQAAFLSAPVAAADKNNEFNAPIPSFSDAPPPASFAEAISAFTETAPIELRDGSGTFIVSDTGVEVKDVMGKVEGNSFLINGRMTGYTPDAPFSISVRSLDNQTLTIPETPRFFNSLPPLVRDIYTIVHPAGTCTMALTLERKSLGSRPILQGEVDNLEGQCACIFFPYILRIAEGRVTFGYDPKTDADYVHIYKIRGRGLPYGPNRNSWIQVDGDVGPLRAEISDPTVVIRASGTNVYSEPDIFRALPPEVRQALKILDADHTGRSPSFHGDFQTTVLHRAGWAWRWTFDTDFQFDDCSGKLVGFPYPVKHMGVDLHLRDGYVDIENAHMNRDDANLRVDGRVTWGAMPPPDAPPKPTVVTTDLRVAVHNLPLDKDLLTALPPDDAAWIKRVGLGGKLDVEGRVFQGVADPARPAMPIDPDEVSFDLSMKLHDGTLWPANGTFSISDLSSRVHLTRDEMELSEIHGRRGGADLTGEGALAWSDGPVDLAMHIKARALPMDSPLYQMLPASGRENWDSIQPKGILDADMTWRGRLGDESGEKARKGIVATPSRGDKETASSLVVLAANPFLNRPVPVFPSPLVSLFPSLPVSPAALPPLFSAIAPGFHATLKPQGMSCTIKLLPYRLDGVTGTITVSPEKIIIADAVAHHGASVINVSGSGSMGDQSRWDLKLSGKKMAVDDEFRKAVPPTLLTMIDAVKFHGNVDFDIPKFVYSGDGIASDTSATRPAVSITQAVATSTPAAIPSAPVDIDMDGAITFDGCSLDAGVPMKNVFGGLKLSSAVRDGKVSTLNGKLAVVRATVADRDLTDISMDLFKPADRQELYLQKIRGTLAGGPVAGEVHLSYPDDGPSRYLLSMVLRNADVATIVNDSDKDLRGELTASLSLEGTWDGTAQRRGRGDVIVTGKELYHLPLMMGLFQVTNLSLPIATPFKTGTARYSIEGPRVNFENVELRSDNMLMSGTGHLDFKTKQVLMNFTTDNPNGLKVPFLNDLIKNARGELLKITIKGTIQEPKVQANSFGTVTTTIDQVFKNDAGK